ncbi:tumor necrosis factor receptor superfamily member 25 isoform X3 [Mesocricetus auratus]|uniref:Tumor necrosis factor receptor superfamily member 25 isoform X3 n=1 Tax=Mesocricetus auratus TaxID=10036 RepID=A0ABM2WIY7_MESAU|nr:tumor necrosis factor receptor superfamily member 25 isoform X3 [Mesocricetus auratus]
MAEEPGRERWPPGAATQGSTVRVPQALLPLLLLLLLPPGGQGQGSSTPGRCDCAGDSQKRYGPFCCKGCPKGHYVKTPCAEPCGNSTCLPCPRGTFLTWGDHFMSGCTRCQACDEMAFQVTLENCSAVSDTRCGCQPGLVCSTDPCRESSPLACLSCSGCAAPPTPGVSTESALEPQTQPAVPEAGGGVGGNAGIRVGRVEWAGVRQGVAASWRSPAAVLVVFWAQLLLGASFLLGATLICTYFRCQPCKPVVPADTAGMETLTSPQTTHISASDSAHTLLAPQDSSGKVCTTVQLVGNHWAPGLSHTQEMAGSQAPQPWNQPPNRTLSLPLAPPLSPAPPAGSPAAMLQPGPQLYDVMDAVPARRWKEFVRTLGLREADIEAVEVEICRFRDQQYEMLKRWRQQQPAGLDAVYAALERMGLEGCAEDLRSRLQHGP